MKRLLKYITRRKVFFHCLLLCFVSILAWGLTTQFWFFMGYESSWLMGVPHTVQGLFRSHAYIYYFNYLLFGWNPAGWYAVAIFLHTIASLLSFFVLLSLTNTFAIASIGSLLFVASITYHDVVTWGSFNSYYALMMICVFSSLIAYRMYCLRKRVFNFILSLFFAFLAFYNRESGIMLVGIILLYDFLFHFKKEKKYFISLLFRFALYIGVVLLYLVIRNAFGDVVGDYADDSVQLRLRLQNDHQYFLLAWRTVLAFGRYYASLWLPYEVLNAFREKFVVLLGHGDTIRFYFFSVIGWFNVLLVSLITFFRSKSTFRKLYFFSLTWTVLWIFMTSFAIPSTDSVLRQEYFWNTRRYEYYSFFGVCLYVAMILFEFNQYLMQVFRNKKFVNAVVPMIVAGFVAINILWLWKIEFGLLTTVHKRTKQFYQSFKRQFPTLPDEVLVYQFPHANGLNDLLGEWSVVRNQEYPNLKNRIYTTESQFARVLEKVSNKSNRLSDVIFLDYSIEKGLQDKTKEALGILHNAKELRLSNDAVSVLPEKTYPVEIPYRLDVTISANSTANQYEVFGSANVHYVEKRAEYIKNSRMEVSATASQRPGEPFFHFMPQNLIDGNFGVRSGWMADSIPAVITIRLEKPENIRGLFFSSEKGPRIPSSYHIDYSMDGSTWEKVLDRKNNTDSERIDYFDKPVLSSFVRLTVDSTTTGAFLYLDEVEVIPESGYEIAKNYQNPKELVANALKTPNAMYAFIKIRWNTDKTYVETPLQEFVVPIRADGLPEKYSFRIPEMEQFSRNGDFFKKNITNIAIEPLGPYNIQILSKSLKPFYEIADTR
ncbi:discoidin domain-containing protein [Candidatus Gottesmanbacteria bacterium]|nr:discoidin domain-containing protein [Candidatus Gottesmanbacteria bacterium]